MSLIRTSLWLNLAALLLCQTTLCQIGLAQIAVDGTLVGDEADYGAVLSVQNTNTQYGNSTNGDPRFANGGSEIDQVAARVLGNRLYVLVTGNLESNFNKLEVFIDSAPGGVNQLNGANLPARVDPYCCPAVSPPTGALQQLSGLRFDAGFEADHYLTFSNGVHTYGSPAISRWTLSAYYAELGAGAAGRKSEVGFQYNPYGVEAGLAQGEPIDQLNNGCSGPADTNCSPPEHEFAEPIDTVNDPANNRGHRDLQNDIALLMAMNNSNSAGVGSGTGAATGAPQNVMTGLEFSLPLSLLGNLFSEIKVTAFIASGSHSHVSNQFAGVGVLRANLGSNFSTMNLGSIAGNQYVTVPNPNLAGDYNRDGAVNAADYTVWRDSLGQTGAGLAADGNLNNQIEVGDYELWSMNFGGPAASGVTSSLAVPEPDSEGLLMLLLVAGIFVSRKRVSVSCFAAVVKTHPTIRINACA